MKHNLILYLAAQEEQQKILSCVDEDGVIDVDKLDAITENFEERVIATVAVIKSMEAKQAGIKAEMQRMMDSYDQALLKLERSDDRLREHLHDCMKLAGAKDVKSLDGMHRAKLYVDRDISVVIDPGAKIPDALLLPQKPAPTREPDKKAIKLMLEAGVDVPGARLEKKDRLEIKQINFFRK